MVMVHFMLLSCHLPGKTEVNHDKP